MFPLKFKYFPPRAALTAPLPILKAIPPGIAILVISSVILPAVVAAAASSNGLIFAKNSSTSAALLVSAPRSIKVAPRDAIPSGILNKPEPIPAMIDLNVPTSSPGIKFSSVETEEDCPISFNNSS